MRKKILIAILMFYSILSVSAAYGVGSYSIEIAGPDGWKASDYPRFSSADQIPLEPGCTIISMTPTGQVCRMGTCKVYMISVGAAGGGGGGGGDVS